MTETQAKSGVTGTSTEADDPAGEAPVSAQTGTSGSATETSEAETSTSSTEASSPATRPETTASESDGAGDTVPAVSAGADSSMEGRAERTTVLSVEELAQTSPGPTDSAGVDSGAKEPTPVSPSPVSPSPVSPSLVTPAPASSGPVSPAGSGTPPTPKSSFVPVVAVPAGSAGSGGTSSAGTGASRSSAAGVTAPNVAPAIARASVAGSAASSAGAAAAGTAAAGTAAAAGTLGRGAAPTALRTPTGAHGVIGGASASTLGVAKAGAAIGAARVSDAVRSARATVAGAATRGPRRARLHLKRIDPWSVMKFAFAVSLVLFVVAIVATSVLYLALDAMGVFSSINNAFSEMAGQAANTSSSFKITAKGVIGTSVLLGAVNMVLFTALMTLGAFVYNVCADLVGGIELTLSEKE
jgi:hypothetical protein